MKDKINNASFYNRYLEKYFSSVAGYQALANAEPDIDDFIAIDLTPIKVDVRPVEINGIVLIIANMLTLNELARFSQVSTSFYHAAHLSTTQHELAFHGQFIGQSTYHKMTAYMRNFSNDDISKLNKLSKRLHQLENHVLVKHPPSETGVFISFIGTATSGATSALVSILFFVADMSENVVNGKQVDTYHPLNDAVPMGLLSVGIGSMACAATIGLTFWKSTRLIKEKAQIAQDIAPVLDNFKASFPKPA